MRETSLESQYGWTRSVDKRASRGRAARMISNGKLASRRLGNTRMEPERSHCLDSQNLTFQMEAGIQDGVHGVGGGSRQIEKWMPVVSRLYV